MFNRSANLSMSTSLLKALPGKLDIKKHSPSILYIPEDRLSFSDTAPQLIASNDSLELKRLSPNLE